MCALPEWRPRVGRTVGLSFPLLGESAPQPFVGEPEAGPRQNFSSQPLVHGRTRSLSIRPRLYISIDPIKLSEYNSTHVLWV